MKKLFELSKFNEYKEDNRREVKAAQGGLPSSLWDTYSSMANTYGGVIICGVKERQDGTWFTTGMKDISKLKKNFWNQANDPSKVSVNLLVEERDIEEYEVNGDVILVIHVPVADREHKPVFINGDLYKGSFKRTNEGDYHCTREEVQAMLRDQSKTTMDMKVIENMELSVFDMESVKAYREWFNVEHKNNSWSKLSNDEFLERIGAASDDTKDRQLHPTAAGLLMFGPEYKIIREYPNYFLEYKAHMVPTVRWTDRIQSQSPDWSGNLFDFFTMVSAKLTRDLDKPFLLNEMVRVEDTDIHKSVREALVNCIANADFFLSRGIVIEKYPDKITFKNPGLSIVGKKQMLRGGDSEPRNSNIMKMLNLLGFGDHAGSGVPDIYETWEKAGLKTPTIEEHFGEEGPTKTIVNLPLVKNDRTKKVSNKTSDTKTRTTKEEIDKKVKERTYAIYKEICKNPMVKNIELEKLVGATKRQVELSINCLKKEGKIKKEEKRKGGWIIL
ncbi:MAG: putative DNA binding domain-containing protein [Lachnospiraceae bacterium]|nr:putative DNA binding domain-containing protein [Lachnospiraceae bacterium]